MAGNYEIVHHEDESMERVWDEVEAVKSLMGKKALLQRLISLFVMNIPGHLKAIDESIKSQDLQACVFVTHTLRGSLGQLMAPKMLGIVQQMERMAKSGDIDGVKGLHDDMLRASDELLELFSHYLETD